MSGFSVQKYVKTKKRPSPKNQWVFGSKEDGCQTKWKKKDIYHKSVELWFHIIIWCHPKWCHPKMVTPGAGQLLAMPLSISTVQL